MGYEQLSMFGPEVIPTVSIETPIILVEGDRVIVEYSDGGRKEEVETQFYMEQFGGKKGAIHNILHGTGKVKYYSIEFDNGSTGIFYENEVKGVTE